MNKRWLAALLAVLHRSCWDADRAAAAENGWTVKPARFGRVVVRDSRFDRLRAQRHRTGQSASPSAQSVASGRWW